MLTVYSSRSTGNLSKGGDATLFYSASKNRSCLSLKMACVSAVSFVTRFVRDLGTIARPFRSSRNTCAIFTNELSRIFVVGGQAAASAAVFFESISSLRGLTVCSRYSTICFTNIHFCALSESCFSLKALKMVFTAFLWSLAFA